MVRNIIQIDRERCVGCGLCVNACQEGAIGLVDGKAMLLRDDYCDGLGKCLPSCPVGALEVVQRKATPFDKAAASAHKAATGKAGAASEGGCPGSRAQSLTPSMGGCPGSRSQTISRPDTSAPADAAPAVASALRQWPVQIKLVPVNAPYFSGAHLLIAADCAAFAMGDFHSRVMKNKITLIGCPKLDEGDYSEKLTAILSQNDIRSVTVARMEVPCCGGLSSAVITALQNCGKMIPWQVVTISTDGRILED
jgi:Fe-S-cluster-containing hydrogenase component 2